MRNRRTRAPQDGSGVRRYEGDRRSAGLFFRPADPCGQSADLCGRSAGLFAEEGLDAVGGGGQGVFELDETLGGGAAHVGAVVVEGGG